VVERTCALHRATIRQQTIREEAQQRSGDPRRHSGKHHVNEVEMNPPLESYQHLRGQGEQAGEGTTGTQSGTATLDKARDHKAK
jgi:hypothetical protein